MADEIIEDNRLIDPLRPQSRLSRRNLLVSSVIGFLVSKGGLVPTKLSALGIEFSKPNQEAFTYLVAAIVIYFITEFTVHGLADYVRWKQHNQQNKHYFAIHALKNGMGFKTYHFAGFVSFLRTMLEFVSPLIVGVAACYSLVVSIKI